MERYTVYDVVTKIIGGEIAPIGETNYDSKAFLRMIDFENLSTLLIDKIGEVANQSGAEASVQSARHAARTWLYSAKESIEELLEEEQEGQEDGKA